MNNTPEQWLPIPGYEGRYDVSDSGNVRSWVPYRGMPIPHRRATPIGSHGYPIVGLDGGTPLVHLLMLLAFVGPRAEGMEARHLDGIKTHGNLANLAYGTSSENSFDLVRHGTHNNARKTQCKHGHPYDAANTLPRVGGGRACRACARRRMAEYADRRSGNNK